MKQLPRLLSFGLVAVFAIGCGIGLHGDIARMSFAALARSWDIILFAALLSLLNYGLRIIRWRGYLARLGFSVPLGFTSLTYLAGFAFTVSPGKVGEIVRGRYYSRAGISMADVAGAFCVERLMDLLAMLALAALILAAAPRYQPALWSAGVMIAVALVLFGSLPWSSMAAALEASPRLPRVLIRLGVGVARALASARTLLSPGPLLFGFVLGLAAWALEGWGLYILSSMFPPSHLDPALGIGIYAVAVLVGAISFLPGGLGSTEAVMTALLAAQGYSLADALLITMVCRVVTLWLAVCIGWGAIFLLRNRTVATVVPWP